MSETERLEERLRAFGASPDGGADWEDVRRRAERRLWARPSRRQLTLAFATVVVVAASVAGVLATRATRPDASACSSALLWSCPRASGPTGGGPTGPPGPVGSPTLAHPLLGGQQVPLDEAENAFGGSLVLPDTAEVGPSGIGAVWLWLVPTVAGPTMAAGQAVTAAAVTYPSQDLMIRYFRRPQYPNTRAFYEGMAKNSPGSEVISLSGVPALASQALQGPRWASVMFIVRGNQIYVEGNTDEALLESVAQSIVDRANG